MSDLNNVEAVLARWRAVERELEAIERSLAGVEPGSPEAMEFNAASSRLVGEWAGLRVGYQRLVDEARTRRRPRPPAWPEPASLQPDPASLPIPNEGAPTAS